MSNLVFTPPPGLSWSVFKIPNMNTLVQTATSGKTTRAQLWANPIWKFKMNWEYLRDGNATPSDVQSILDFFLARGGSFDTFLYTDPTDNAVTTMNFGTGDGVTVAFQLSRKWANFSESIQNINGTPSIFKNAALLTAGVDYSINTTGLVTFAVAPAAAAALTWTGSFYYRLRFEKDLYEFEQFVQNLWALKTLELITERL